MSIYVKHGTIKSMKSSHLLSLAYSYEQQNRNFICLKPSTDTRDIGYIRSSDGFNTCAKQTSFAGTRTRVIRKRFPLRFSKSSRKIFSKSCSFVIRDICALPIFLLHYRLHSLVNHGSILQSRSLLT